MADPPGKAQRPPNSWGMSRWGQESLAAAVPRSTRRRRGTKLAARRVPEWRTTTPGIRDDCRARKVPRAASSYTVSSQYRTCRGFERRGVITDVTTRRSPRCSRSAFRRRSTLGTEPQPRREHECIIRWCFPLLYHLPRHRGNIYASARYSGGVSPLGFWDYQYPHRHHLVPRPGDLSLRTLVTPAPLTINSSRRPTHQWHQPTYQLRFKPESHHDMIPFDPRISTGLRRGGSSPSEASSIVGEWWWIGV